MAKIYVGVSLIDSKNSVAATTKAGLAKLIGVNVATVRRNLGGILLPAGDRWLVQEVELVKIERGKGKPGKVGDWSGGFRGMKGEKGLLVAKREGQGAPAGRKLV